MFSSGPRIGWTVGGLGSLIWLPAMAILLNNHGEAMAALVDILIMMLGILHIWINAPWKKPDVKISRLYIGMVGILISGAFYNLAVMIPITGWDWTNLWWLLFLLVIFFPGSHFGGKTWREMHGDQG